MSNLTKEEEEALSLQLAMQLQEEWNKPASTSTGNVAGEAFEKAELHTGLSEEEKKQLVRRKSNINQHETDYFYRRYRKILICNWLSNCKRESGRSRNRRNLFGSRLLTRQHHINLTARFVLRTT